MQIWDILEIEPTTNIRDIKRAYATLSKKYHPEDHPEKWQMISEAYQAALNYVRWQNSDQYIENIKINDPPVPYQRKINNKEPLQTEHEADLYDFDIIERQQSQLRDNDKIQKVLEEAKGIITHYYSRNKLQCWHDFLHSDAFNEVADEQEFMDGLADLLSCYTGPWLWPETMAQIADYYHLSNYVNLADTGKYTKLFRVLYNGSVHRAEYDADTDKRYREIEKGKRKNVLLRCAFFMGFLLSPLLFWLLGYLIFIKPIFLLIIGVICFAVRYYLKRR